MTDWSLVFMDENNNVFHRETIDSNTPLPQSPTWNFQNGTAEEVKQFLQIPNWVGEDNLTVYYTVLDYVNKEFVVSVHGIYGDAT